MPPAAMGASRSLVNENDSGMNVKSQANLGSNSSYGAFGAKQSNTAIGGAAAMSRPNFTG